MYVNSKSKSQLRIFDFGFILQPVHVLVSILARKFIKLWSLNGNIYSCVSKQTLIPRLTLQRQPSPSWSGKRSVFLRTASSVIPRRHWQVSARPVCSGKPCVLQDDRRAKASNPLLQLCMAIVVQPHAINTVIVWDRTLLLSKRICLTTNRQLCGKTISGTKTRLAQFQKHGQVFRSCAVLKKLFPPKLPQHTADWNRGAKPCTKQKRRAPQAMPVPAQSWSDRVAMWFSPVYFLVMCF